jgi:hypothetical protein
MWLHQKEMWGKILLQLSEAYTASLFCCCWLVTTLLAMGNAEQLNIAAPRSEKLTNFDNFALVLSAAYFHSIGVRYAAFLFSESGGSMSYQRKTKYVSGWVSPEQYAKMSTLAALKGSSSSAVLRELIDSANVETVMPQKRKERRWCPPRQCQRRSLIIIAQ